MDYIASIPIIESKSTLSYLMLKKQDFRVVCAGHLVCEEDFKTVLCSKNGASDRLYALSLIFSVFYVDIDECENGENSCHANALCSNTAGSYVCRCIRGFEGDGRTCVGNSV